MEGKVLVIGGGGFLGSHLLQLLLFSPKSRYNGGLKTVSCIRVFDKKFLLGSKKLLRSHCSDPEAKSDTSIEFIKGDIRNLDQLEKAANGCSVVFHLASIVHWSLNPHPHIHDINVKGTSNVITVCQKLDIKCLVYTSTMDVVLTGAPITDANANEPYPTHPLNDYISTKIEAEKLVRAANDSKTATEGVLRTCCLRPGHIYGERDPHALCTVVSKVRSGRLPVLLGNPVSAKIDVTYVGNVAHAHILAALALTSGVTAVAGNAYHVSEGNHQNWWHWVKPYLEAKGLVLTTWYLPYCVVYVLALLAEILHRIYTGITGVLPLPSAVRKRLPVFDPTLTLFICAVLCRDFTFNSKRARKDFGYQPLVSKEEALRRTLKWIKSQDC
jgi:nucleoside-diphosphate-sugar epimerase